jgi:hypothetical protein
MIATSLAFLSMVSGDTQKEEFLKKRSLFVHKTIARVHMLLRQHFISIFGTSI